MLYKCYFYIGVKRQSANKTQINRLIQSTANENKIETRDISIKLVDITKTYKKQETTKTDTVNNEQNQFYIDRISTKKESFGSNRKVGDIIVSFL